jgi:glyoxylase-like metal-dependent hydrolase (beta-lactamase superfamily II)
MSSQISIGAAEAAIQTEDGLSTITPDLTTQRVGIVNIVYYGSPGVRGGDWVLIDAGITGAARKVRERAREMFGEKPPRAIILTHGHFDHVGALRKLCEEWQVPVYAHPLEWPYLDGRSGYPPPDPTVGGGLMAALSPLYPRGPIDVSPWLRPLPVDGSVPFMPGWRWISTPGHSPGHISLWREADRTVIAGDAFITTDQESAYAVARQIPQVHGPPMYYTQNWDKARESVKYLADLRPLRAITGHGPSLEGPDLSAGLEALAENFDSIARPRHGRYVREPARSEFSGRIHVRPKTGGVLSKVVSSRLGLCLTAGVVAAIPILWFAMRRGKKVAGACDRRESTISSRRAAQCRQR